MHKKELLQKARKLSSVSNQAALEIDEKSDLLISHINKNLSGRDDIESLVGSGNIKLMKMNHKNHIRFLSSIMTEYDPGVFVETVLWAIRTYMARGFKKEYWDIQLNEWLMLFKDHLSDNTYREVSPFYNFILNNLTELIEANKNES